MSDSYFSVSEADGANRLEVSSGIHLPYRNGVQLLGLGLQGQQRPQLFDSSWI